MKRCVTATIIVGLALVFVVLLLPRSAVAAPSEAWFTSRLTSNSVNDSQPVVSADRIAWLRQSSGKAQVYTWSPSGGTVQLASDSYGDRPRVSGDRVAWCSSDGHDYEIYTWTPDGGTVRLTSNTYMDIWVDVSGDRVVWGGADLIESNIIENLNDPCILEDTSWIKPGKCAWDWWWCGKYAPDVNSTLGSNTATMKYFIDFAAEMGWEYQLIDWQWYGEPFKTRYKEANPDSDITKSIPDINIPELVHYANGKNVRLILWLHWQHAAKQMDEAFALYEKWGIAGVKIDFMKRDDQDMVNFYHCAVKKAAEHHLLVDFHGAYKPDGFNRTYPNLITREGVMGNEWNKWTARVTPDHCLTLPFTRMLAGPMDFTPGGFLNVRKDDFKFGKMGVDAGPTYVMGTRCFQLAMMVVYDSPLQVLCDSPYNYRHSPSGLDFLKIVPTTWDQTKVLNAQVGDFITIAGRKGDEWFIGSMTDWTPRSLEIPLDFLGKGKYEATIWSDASDADTNPQHLTKQTMLVTAKDKITAKLSPAGGQVIHLKPVK